jgi:hypothetical protein
MLVTVEGIVTFVSPAHPENADAPILVTGFPAMIEGTSISPTADVG